MSSWDDFKKVAEETVGKAPGAGQYVHVHRDSAFELIAERDALLAERDALRSALERFYNANQARLKLLSREVYLDMQRLPGMRDALYEMDDAQHQAYAALQGAQP